MNKSKTFSKAWKLARKGAKKFGGTAKSYFSASLHIIYEANKLMDTIDMNRFEMLNSQPKLSRDEALELAAYQATESKASFMRTMNTEFERQFEESTILIANLTSTSSAAMIYNDYLTGIVILKP